MQTMRLAEADKTYKEPLLSPYLTMHVLGFLALPGLESHPERVWPPPAGTLTTVPFDWLLGRGIDLFAPDARHQHGVLKSTAAGGRRRRGVAVRDSFPTTQEPVHFSDGSKTADRVVPSPGAFSVALSPLLKWQMVVSSQCWGPSALLATIDPKLLLYSCGSTEQTKRANM